MTQTKQPPANPGRFSTALVGKVAKVSAQPYRGRESDLGDILHMAYLPYVDIFRCDRGNAPVAEAVVSEFGLDTKVASSIDDVLRYLETSRVTPSAISPS